MEEGAYLVAMTPKVEVTPMLMVSLSVVAQLVVSLYFMSMDEQKMLGRLLIFSPPRFSSALGDDAYEFLNVLKDRIHNLVLVEMCGMDYTTF